MQSANIIFQIFQKTQQMGAQCMATTVNQHYSKYLQSIKVSELKDFWTTIQLYKMKKIYEKKSSKHPEYAKHTHITFEKFKEIFPQIEKYQQIHKKRLFQIFDHDSQGYVDWNNFYASISICYFGSEEILSIIMFMIFDDFLSKNLNHQQLTVLCESNSNYIVQNHQTQMFQPQQIVQQLLKGKPSIGIQQWIKRSQRYFQFGKYRRFFNIFIEEQMEKELVKNFNKWNNLYQEDQERYISYVISYKWFQTWKIYILQQYGVNLGIINPQAPNRTFKTKKTIKSIKDDNLNKNNKKVADLHHLHEIKIKYEKVESPSQIKNYDYIHSNIGQKPREIYNNVLQGQFEEIMKRELIQNRDYVFVSQKVWEFLKKIYEGYPQFRRTGVDAIQLYPKIVKAYSQMFRDKIDFSSEIIREVSGYLTVEELLSKSLQITHEELNDKVVFFKTIGMVRWQQLPDLNYMFTQLSPQPIIFLFYINKSQAENFKKIHYKLNKQINQITIGDYLTFSDSSNKNATNKKNQKIAVYMGNNLEGKCVLHFPGESYIYDLCVMEEQLFKKGKMFTNQSIKSDNLKLKKKAKSDLIGISNVKGIGFINSLILNLYMNENFRKNILLVNSNEIQKEPQEKQLLQIIADIFNKLQKKQKVDPTDIIDMIDIQLSQFQNFEFSMCQQFLETFLTRLMGQFLKRQMKNLVNQEFMYSMKRKVTCSQCNQAIETVQDKKYLSLPIPQKNQSYYEVIFVPFSKTLKSQQLKKYGFKLSSNATFKDYKEAFQAAAQINSNHVHYIFAQVYSNNIIKNFSTTKLEATLKQLCLRENDVIFAYELFVNFDGFIMDHYSGTKDIVNKDFKVDQFIDCKHDDRGWIFGKIRQIEYLPYTHRTILRVIHKFSKNQQWEISYDLNQDNIGNFPTKSYLNAEQYHLRLLQRYYNEPSNQMQICNIPLVTVLTSWMRWKEFYYLIYLQLKPFIQEEFAFTDEQNNQKEQIKLCSGKSLDMKNSRSKNKTNKIKLNKFKDYLYSDQFPYKVNFTDRDGRCAICFKFLKMLVLKGENGSYCEGCSLSAYEPISWQIKPADVMVCIDWKNIGFMNKNIVKDHSSFINLQVNKINDSELLTNCLKERVNNNYFEQQQPLCCNKLTKCTIHQTLVSNPQNLIIMLQRIVEDQGFKRTIHRHISFNLQDFQVNGQLYELYGVTAIQGTSKNTKYTVYIIKDKSAGQWHQFDGQHVSIVKKNVIEKLCAYVLFYKKKK